MLDRRFWVDIDGRNQPTGVSGDNKAVWEKKNRDPRDWGWGANLYSILAGTTITQGVSLTSADTRAIHQNSKQAHVKQAPAPSSSKRSALPTPPSGNLHTLWRDESRTRFWYDRAISFATICARPENESGLVDLSGGRRIRALAGWLCSHRNRWKFEHLQDLERHIHSIIIRILRRSGKPTSRGRRRSCPFKSNPVNTPQQSRKVIVTVSFAMGWQRGFAYASFYFWEASRPSYSWLVCLALLTWHLQALVLHLLVESSK